MDIVLVIGAGASKSLHKDFGTGKELIQQIEERVTDRTSPENPYFSKIFPEKTGIRREELSTFHSNLEYYINNSGAGSIDEFLTEIEIFPEYGNWKEEYLKVGKTLILFHILGWERKLNEAIQKGEIDISSTWIGEVISFIEKEKLLSAYMNHSSSVLSSLQIITFNYDRTLEYFLTKHFISQAPLIEEWIKHNIFHVYGSVSLKELKFGFKNDEFDQIVNHLNKFETAYNKRPLKREFSIRKSNQLREMSGENASNLIVNGNKIVCMGFGFDYFNCRNIGLNQDIGVTANIVTRDEPTEFYKTRREEVRRIRTMFNKVDFEFLSCKDFVNKMLF